MITNEAQEGEEAAGGTAAAAAGCGRFAAAAYPLRPGQSFCRPIRCPGCCRPRGRFRGAGWQLDLPTSSLELSELAAEPSRRCASRRAAGKLRGHCRASCAGNRTAGSLAFGEHPSRRRPALPCLDVSARWHPACCRRRAAVAAAPAASSPGCGGPSSYSPAASPARSPSLQRPLGPQAFSPAPQGSEGPPAAASRPPCRLRGAFLHRPGRSAQDEWRPSPQGSPLSRLVQALRLRARPELVRIQRRPEPPRRCAHTFVRLALACLFPYGTPRFSALNLRNHRELSWSLSSIISRLPPPCAAVSRGGFCSAVQGKKANP